MKAKLDKQKNSDSGDIVNLILRDHTPLKELIEILKDSEADASDKMVAFEKFAPLLLSHAEPEEESLYVFMKEYDELIVEALEGDTEHALASQLVGEIYDTDDENLWTAKVKVLAEMVEHHIEEEEEKMLPEFKKNSSEEERISLGREYLRLKSQMTGGASYKDFEKSEMYAH